MNNNIEEIKKEVVELKHHIKEIDENLGYLIKEKSYLEPNVELYKNMRLNELITKKKKIEYQLITEARSVKAEKKYLDKLLNIEKRIKENEYLFEAYKRYNNVIKQIELLTKQKEHLNKKLNELLEKLKEEAERAKKIKPKKKKEIVKEEQEEAQPNSKKDYISLEDLINQK